MNAWTSWLKAGRSNPVSTVRFGITLSARPAARVGSSSVRSTAMRPSVLMNSCWRWMRSMSACGLAFCHFPSMEVLEVARPYVGKRLRTIEVVAARERADAEPRQHVAHVVREEDRHAPDRVHDVLEGLEVHLDVVVDRHVEVLLQRVDHELRALVERGVDLLAAERRHVHHEVARERHDVAGVTVGMQHHHRVGARRAVGGGVGVGEGLLVLLALHERARVGADDKVVRGGAGRGCSRELDARDLADPVVDASS